MRCSNLKGVIKSSHSGTYGIEVELEGQLYWDEGHWAMIDDNSLRNGKEYVLRRPVSEDVLKKATDEFDFFVSKSKIKNSLRCSTHIHINMGGREIGSAFLGALRYYFFEELFLDTQPSNRRGNLHCLRMKDAGIITRKLRSAISEPRFTYSTLSQSFFKYTALNLNSLNVLGSLEFRFLGPITKGFELRRWCRTLKDVLKDRDNLSLFEYFEENGAKKTIINVFGKRARFLIRGCSDDYLTDLLETNIDTVRDLTTQINTKTHTLPRSWINNDEINQREF